MTQQNSDRTLFYYPIIHSEAEMGSLHGLSQKVIRERSGSLNAKAHAKQISHFWDRVKESVYQLALDNITLRIYQDGLPVCNQILTIVNELAKKGSINHQLILYLQQKGAILMGTESPDFLLQEYQLIKDFLVECTDINTPPDAERFKIQSKKTLEKRDRFIADRINSTLQSGEKGVLFLGQLHDIKPYLAQDIKVITPDIEIPFAQGEHNNE